MLAQARYLADFGRFLIARPGQERDDAEARAALERRPASLPRGLTVQWLGVSGYRMTCEGHTLIIDPYLSRVTLGDVLRRRPALPDPTLIDRYLPGLTARDAAGGEQVAARDAAGVVGTGRDHQLREQVVGVLVGHTHFDHAVDAPAIARRTGCRAYGSESLKRLMELHGLGRQAVVVTPGRSYELGPFTVRFHRSLHSKLLLGLAVPYDGEFTCDHLDGLAAGAYRCGQVYGISIEVAGTSFYHQGSANLLDEEVPRADVFLGGVAGRGFTRDYWARILRRLQPHTVIPTHYDDFFRPLDQPMGFTTNVHLSQVPDEVAQVSRDIEVAALPLLEAVSG